MKRRLSFPFRLRREISHPAVLIIVFIGFLPFLSKAQMQNLVPDSSFEDINPDATFGWNEFNVISNYWFSPTQATPDLFTTIKSVKNEVKKKRASFLGRGNSSTGLYVEGLYAPKTQFGFQYPKSGEVFAGFVAGQTLSFYREYVAIKLIKPLVNGRCYSFRIFLNLPDLSNYNGIDVGCNFLSEEGINTNKIKHNKNPIIYPSTISKIDTFKLEPDIIFNLENFKDTINWVGFTGGYIAKGGEEYLIVGPHWNAKFKNTLTNKILKPNKANTYATVYYFIDDVSLIEQADTNQCVCKKAVADTVAKVVPIKQPVIADTKPFVIPNLYFETNKWDILPKSFKSLDSVATHLKTLKGVRIEVSGHTDNVGTEEDNLKLSENRAKAVADYLISKGVNKPIVSAKGYGEAVPVGTVKDRNRRVEIRLIR